VKFTHVILGLSSAALLAGSATAQVDQGAAAPTAASTPAPTEPVKLSKKGKKAKHDTHSTVTEGSGVASPAPADNSTVTPVPDPTPAATPDTPEAPRA
jgi:hypothetical protein